jgi:hypothetical protein
MFDLPQSSARPIVTLLFLIKSIIRLFSFFLDNLKKESSWQNWVIKDYSEDCFHYLVTLFGYVVLQRNQDFVVSLQGGNLHFS